MYISWDTNPDATMVDFIEDGVSSLVQKGGKEFLRIGYTKADIRDARSCARVIRRAVRTALSLKLAAIQIPPVYALLGGDWCSDEHVFIRHLAENLVMASHEFTLFKSEPDTSPRLDIFVTGNPSSQQAFNEGVIIGEACNFARELADTPPNILTPTALAERTKKELTASPLVSVAVLNRDEIEQQKMGLLAAVGQGAKTPPRLIVITYNGGDTDEQPIVLIGKGITYDTGGISLKENPLGMQRDMSGAGSVIAAIRAASELGIKKNIVGVIPAAENAIGGGAYLVDAILTSMSGRTVEVRNTDAEGRLVLADAITFASTNWKPRLVVTVATLTGACRTALGSYYTGLFTEDRDLESQLRDIGEYAGDPVWPLPPGSEYDEMFRSKVADLANVISDGGKEGGASVGYRFLAQFAADLPEGVPYVHLDMAPRMTAIASDNLVTGLSSGDPVRFLVRLLELETV